MKFLPAQSYTVTEENSLWPHAIAEMAVHGNQIHALPFHSLYMRKSAAGFGPAVAN